MTWRTEKKRRGGPREPSERISGGRGPRGER